MPRGVASPPSHASAAAGASREGFDEQELEELREFLAPLEPTPIADPIFKARLRLDLWWMLECQRQAGRRRSDRR